MVAPYLQYIHVNNSEFDSNTPKIVEEYWNSPAATLQLIKESKFIVFQQQ